MKYSASKEDYLKAIFHLQTEQSMVTTNALAVAMQARPASITDMLKKLKSEKLLIYERYKGFRLNNEGKKIAVQVIRKHRLWEYFLVHKLKFGWDEVHEVAEELEHITSKKLIDQLDAFLNFPVTDPHGDPIPDRSGKFNSPKQLNLLDFPMNTPAKVSSVASQTSDILELLDHKSIHIGTRLEIRKKFLFDNSIELKVKNQAPITVSEQVAQKIFVHNDE